MIRPSNSPVDIMLISYLKGPKEKRVGTRSGDGPAYMQVVVWRGAENDSFQRVQNVGNDIQLGIDPIKVVIDAGFPKGITENTTAADPGNRVRPANFKAGVVKSTLLC
jgi:hypothetical protein